MVLAINIFLAVLAAYFGIGLLFGVYFLIKGAPKVDALFANSKKRVRFLLVPGVIAIWPFLVRKLFKSKTT